MTKEELYAHPGWQWCTSEGAALHTLLIGLETTFREKLERSLTTSLLQLAPQEQWLEEAEELTMNLRSSREKHQATKKL